MLKTSRFFLWRENSSAVFLDEARHWFLCVSDGATVHQLGVGVPLAILMQHTVTGDLAHVKPTNIGAHDYFHKVVDCQWACPAHTPVPEYIRLNAAGRYSDAYMINWRANVFHCILFGLRDSPREHA